MIAVSFTETQMRKLREMLDLDPNETLTSQSILDELDARGIAADDMELSQKSRGNALMQDALSRNRTDRKARKAMGLPPSKIVSITKDPIRFR
jgi:hypothetical protein